MTKKIKKGSVQQDTLIKKTAVKDPLITFSFRFFDPTDGTLCPGIFKDGYTQTLMQRLRALSEWTLQDFYGPPGQNIRAHTHTWSETARPDGFARLLNEELRASPGWQFSISANKYGRVHGIMIDSTFYIIWLDQNHALYP